MDNTSKALAFLILAVPLLCACGTSAGTPVAPGPTSTVESPTAVPATPTSGTAVGVPVVSGGWEVTITNVHQESGVSCLTSTGASSSSALAPYTYLVVDAILRPLDSGDTAPATSNEAVLLTEDGTAVNASGGGTQGNYCLNTVVAFETESAGFVFLMKEETLTQALRFQFRDGPAIPLAIGGQ